MVSEVLVIQLVDRSEKEGKKKLDLWGVGKLICLRGWF